MTLIEIQFVLCPIVGLMTGGRHAWEHGTVAVVLGASLGLTIGVAAVFVACTSFVLALRLSEEERNS